MEMDYPNDKYWAEYLKWCKQDNVRPSISDFVVWCDDLGLIEHV